MSTLRSAFILQKTANFYVTNLYDMTIIIVNIIRRKVKNYGKEES